MFKKVKRFIANFLGINIYNINGVRGYNRVYESKTMDCIEFVYDKLKIAYNFIAKIVYSIALYSTTLFFMIVPLGGQSAPLERAKLLVTGMRRERNTLLEEYQAQFNDIYNNADDASVVYADIMAMDDEQRVAHFRQGFEDAKFALEQKDRDRDDEMSRFGVQYDDFTIFFKRTGYHDYYRVSQVGSVTVDGHTTYTVLLSKSKTKTDILKDITKELQKKHKKEIKKIDDKLVLDVPKIEVAITEFIEYKGIPVRRQERPRIINEHYQGIIDIAEKFEAMKQAEKDQTDKDIAELYDKYAKKD